MNLRDATYWRLVEDVTAPYVGNKALNSRLNWSEDRLRKQIGKRKVDALVRRFKVAALKDQALLSALYEQPDPYLWLAEHWASSRSPR